MGDIEDATSRCRSQKNGISDTTISASSPTVNSQQVVDQQVGEVGEGAAPEHLWGPEREQLLQRDEEHEHTAMPTTAVPRVTSAASSSPTVSSPMARPLLVGRPGSERPGPRPGSGGWGSDPRGSDGWGAGVGSWRLLRQGLPPV